MTRRELPSFLWSLIEPAIAQILRRPYLSLSVVAHAGMLVLLYYFGSYQPELRQQEADVASSLRATSLASTAKRLQDLQTIKRLLEESANRVDSPAQPSADPSAPPQTPEEMVERARELSQEIDSLDKEIKAEELAGLIGESELPTEAPLPPVAETAANSESKTNDGQTEVTPESAASEVAELETKARTTLEKRQERLEARANGVEVGGAEESGAGGQVKDGQGAGGQGKDGQGAGGKGAGRSASVRAEIADFIAAGKSSEPTPESTGYASHDFFDAGNSVIPTVDASSLVRGRGRMLGAGGEYANRVYLNSWYVIGPFLGRHGRSLFESPSYPPEKAVLLDAVYFGKDKRLLQWRYVTSQEYPFYPPDMAEDSVYYGYTEVFVDEACDLTAWIGVDDDVQIWFNDALVWKGGNVNKGSYFNAIFNTRNDSYLRDYNRTEGKRVLHFNKGRNKIFFKMSNGPNRAFLSMVLTR